MILIFRYSVHKRVYSNGLKLLHEVPGTIKKENFFMAVPHSFKFQYKNKTCYVTGSVDSMLDYSLEYIYPMEKEIELRIFRSTHFFNTRKAIDEKTFSKFYRFISEKKYIYDLLVSEKKVFEALLQMLQDFDQILFGKDNSCRLITRYNSFLIKPNKILSTFHNIKILADFLENNLDG